MIDSNLLLCKSATDPCQLLSITEWMRECVDEKMRQEVERVRQTVEKKATAQHGSDGEERKIKVKGDVSGGEGAEEGAIKD